MLFEAVQNGDLERVATLLDNGADVNERDDKFFNTALHRSIFAQENRYELTDLLISRGADCNALNKKYLTASELALEKKLDDLAKHMIRRETEYIDNHLAYYLLIRRGNLQLFEFLISIKRLKYDDEILIIAKAYAELKLKNVPLKEHMEAYLNEILINHDYWLINSRNGEQHKKDRGQNVHRIREIIDNVRELLTSYDNHNLMDVDSVFLLRLSYILENIFFIRNQYKELPLHHVEFCIGIFLHIWKNPPHYDVYRTMIDKRQLLIYLEAIVNELRKIVALPCYNLTPSPSPPPSALPDSTNTSSTESASSPIGTNSIPSKSRTRFRWSTELNRELLFCYYVVTTGGHNLVGYRQRFHDLWCTRQVALSYLTEQNLFSQLRRIQRDQLLPDDVCRKLRLEADEYGFDYHCSRSRPLKISDKNRKVFRKLAKHYSRMKELHSVNRALHYLNSVIDMKFNASREIDVLAMKRVAQILGETIRNSKDTSNIGKHLRSFLSIIVPKYFLNNTKARHYLSHCRRDFSSLMYAIDEQMDYAELHRNLRILRNLLLYVQNFQYILAIKTLMNRLYDSKCIEEVKSYYAYIFRNNSKDFLKDLEFAPFLLLEIDSIVSALIDEQRKAGLAPSGRVEEVKLRVRKEIDSYKTLHHQFSSTILMIDCIVSKIKSNHCHEKIRHLVRSHLRAFQIDSKVSEFFLNKLRSQLLLYLYDDLESTGNEQIQSHSALLVARVLCAIDHQYIKSGSFDVNYLKTLTLPFADDCMTLIARLETKSGRSFDCLRYDSMFQKSKDHPNKRYDILRQYLAKHKIVLEASILNELIQEDADFTESRVNKLQDLFLDQNMNIRTLNRVEEIAFEMVMLEATWALSPKLPNNADSLLNYVPVLTGRNLRNYLAHGSITYEVLISNVSFKTILLNALSMIKLSKNIISEIYDRHSWDFRERLACLKHQTSLLEGFRFQRCDDILATIKREQYLLGRNHLNHGIVDQLVQTQSCLLLGHLLDVDRVNDLLKVLCYLMEDISVIPASGKLHNLIADVPARVRFCYNLALLINNEDILLKIVADFGYDQIDAIPMIFNFDKLFTSLLENHPEYDVNADSNVEILHYAVLSGNVELLNLLLDQCNELNQRDIYNLTPLDVACKLSNLEMIKTLTNAGARWYTNDLSQYTWLFLNNDHEAIIFLKNNDLLNEKITRACINLFLQYCDDDKEEILEFMLSSVDYANLYVVAARFRRVAALKFMIANDERLEININRKDSMGQTALHVACCRGYHDVVQLILAQGGDLNLQDEAGNTALHLAVECGSVEVTKLLLKQNVNIDVENQMSKTPLDLAAQLENVRIVKLLLKQKQPLRVVRIPEALQSLEVLCVLRMASVQYKLEPDVSYRLTPLHCVEDEGRLRILLQYFHVDDQSSRFMDTPLHLACLMNRANIVRLLLQYGANPSLTNCDNLLPLHLAVINRNAEIVRMLMTYVEKLDMDCVNSVLAIAVRKGFLGIASIVLEFGADISVLSTVSGDSELNLLHTAAREGFLAILRYLLQEQIFDVNVEDCNGLTPLFHAVINGNVEIVEVLLQHGANLDHTTKSGQNAINIATMYDHLDIIRYFVNNFPTIVDYILSPFRGQNTCLHIAVLKGSQATVEYFIKLHLDNGHHLDAQNQEGFTALHICAQTGNDRLFRILLESGADPSIALNNKQSILHTAVSNKSMNIVRIVLDRGLIALNARDDDGRTILHYSVYSKDVSVVRELLKIPGLQINQQDCEGNSALHLAAENQFIDIYNLLRRRVDNELRNQGRKRAIDVLLRK